MKGFTLVELAVVIGIVAIISVVAFLGLTNYRGEQNLKLSMTELITVFRDVQKRSITQEDGSRWGIKLTNPQDGDSHYEVFKGASYASGILDKFYALRRGVKFSEPYSASNYETVFAPLSGGAFQNKIISLVNKQNDSPVGDIILNTLGSVFSRIEKEVLGYWHFDEGSGNAAHDASPFGNSGTLTNGPTWQSGLGCKAGDCLLFERAQLNFISGTLNQTTILSAFTIEAWTKITGNQNAAIFSAQNGQFVNNISAKFLADSRRPSFSTLPDGEQNDDEVIAGTSLNINAWHHLAYVYDGQYKKIYINGVKDAEAQISPDKVFTIYFFEIGRNERQDNFILDGFLDEVRFYKRALSDEEILNHYNDFK